MFSWIELKIQRIELKILRHVQSAETPAGKSSILDGGTRLAGPRETTK
jgi:hypothetical protein